MKSASVFGRNWDPRSKTSTGNHACLQCWNSLKEYHNASKNFENSSTQYILAAEENVDLAEYYKEYALYMQAWSELEKAKQFHIEKKYELAKDQYEINIDEKIAKKARNALAKMIKYV